MNNNKMIKKSLRFKPFVSKSYIQKPSLILGTIYISFIYFPTLIFDSVALFLKMC